MKQACAATGMSYEALKFYCNEGLVPNVKRAANNYRVFDEHDVNWIRSLACLKRCGMSIQEMKEYLALCLQGQSTIHGSRIHVDKSLLFGDPLGDGALSGPSGTVDGDSNHL